MLLQYCSIGSIACHVYSTGCCRVDVGGSISVSIPHVIIIILITLSHNDFASMNCCAMQSNQKLLLIYELNQLKGSKTDHLEQIEVTTPSRGSSVCLWLSCVLVLMHRLFNRNAFTMTADGITFPDALAAAATIYSRTKPSTYLYIKWCWAEKWERDPPLCSVSECV